MAGVSPRIKRTRRGKYLLRLPEGEREVLRSLPAQLRQLLSTDDASLRRLFPPAHADDPQANAEYTSLVRDDLMAERMARLELMETTIDAARLDEQELLAWLGVLNDLRLVLGTRLDVTEDMYEEEMPGDDPRAPAFELFRYLGFVEEQIVEALAAGWGPGP